MKKYKKNSICSVLSFLFYAVISAQNPHPAFRQYTVEDGLPSSEVYQIKQDSKGYIWFATGNGVSRFNGYEFENFSMNNGLPDNTVFDIYEDHKGRIWFIPISCKLSYYYNGKIYPFKYNDSLQKWLKNPIKSSFSIDKEDNVFLGVRWNGIYKISEEGQITDVTDTTAAINVIQTGTDGIVYASNRSENNNSIAFNTSWVRGTKTLKDSVESFNLSSTLIKTRGHTFVFSMNKTLYLLDTIHAIREESFPKRIIWISEDDERELWVGTDLGGVYRIGNNNFKEKSNYLPGISINGVLQDSEGGFWFASENNGVFYTPSKHILTYDDHAGLKSSKINWLTTHKEDIYVGLPSGFIQKISPDGITTYNCNLKGQTGNYITRLHYDPLKEQLWVAGKLQCGVIKNGKFTQNNLFGFFNTIIPVARNTYFSAHSNGLHIIKNDTLVNPVNATLFPERRRTDAILKNNNDEVLIGAIDGLWTKTNTDTTFLYRGNENPLLQHRILDMAYVSDSLTAIATKGAGLLLYDRDKNIHQINTLKGLYSDNVNKIWVALPHIWLATDSGLNKITITQNKTYEVNGYTTADGIASNEVIGVTKVADKIWVATNRGLSVFHPQQWRKSNIQLPVYIHKVLINEEDGTLKENYRLKHHQNNIKINFIGLGYKNAGNLNYRYKMEGLDTTWAYTRNREIQYTTLPPGTYNFKVSVRNLNNEWSTTPATIAFMIQKPYWQQWWFGIILIVAFLLLIVLLVKYRIKQIKTRAAKKSELNKTLLNLKLKALRAQMNPHFTFNVINSIQHFILHKDTESAYRYLSKFSKLIRVILNNSEKSMIPIAEELKALELYFELEAMRFEKQFDYHIIIDPSIPVKTTEIPSMLIQPYAENAIKHGILPLKEKGEITIEIQKQGTLLKCSIEDNGIGRDQAAQRTVKGHRSLGTVITKDRLIVINKLNNSSLSEKTIDLKDETGNPLGTRVEIFIPIN
ncbi:MAG: histidine kinase [Bacteroidota bacterium]